MRLLQRDGLEQMHAGTIGDSTAREGVIAAAQQRGESSVAWLSTKQPFAPPS
jgi:hypothetical protein